MDFKLAASGKEQGQATNHKVYLREQLLDSGSIFLADEFF
jgi:hypothetical protein